MDRYTVRRFEERDAQAVSDMIAKTAYITNSKVYDSYYIKNFLEWVSPEKIAERASWTHYYVICDGDKIICSGAIGPHLDREDESEFFNLFLMPEYQGLGLGKMMVDTLEQDEFFLRAKRIYVHSSLNALKFYQKLGYDHVNGEFAIDEDDNYMLEKFR